MSSPQVQARGFQVPYQGFPANLTLAQALRPYPQFSSIGTRWASRGNTWYDSLQVKVTKRYSHGLTMTGGFTWQKELVLGALSGLAISQSPQAVNDIFNRQQNKYISGDSQPLQFVAGFTYQTPAIGENRFVRDIVARLEFQRHPALCQRASDPGAGRSEQSEHASIPKHHGEPRAGRAAVSERSELPLHRSKQGLRAESCSVVGSGSRASSAQPPPTTTTIDISGVR